MLRRRWGLALVIVAVLVLLAAGTVALRAALRHPDMVTLSGHVSGWASQMGLDAAPMGLDARTHRAFFITDAAIPGQIPPRGVPSYLDTVDMTTGALVRSVQLGPAPFALVIDEQTARVFVADIVDGTVRMFDARNGAFLRTLSISPLAPNDLAVDAQTGRVFVASTLYNAVSTLDARTGALLRTVRNAGDVLAINEQTGRVFAFIANNGSATNAVAVLDARSGVLLRSVPVNEMPLQIAATTTGGIVAVATYASTLLLDGHTGRIRRTLITRVPQRVVSAAGGRLLLTDYYVGLNAQHLSLVDSRTGQMMRTPVVGVTDANQLAVDRQRGRVFAFSGGPNASGSGTVWMIDARSGAVLHTEAIAGSPAAIAVDERAGRVFVAVGATDRTGAPIGPSNVTVLDARNGHVLQTIPLAMPPTALLVDEQAGHVVVVMGGGAPQTSDTWGWIPPSLRRWLPFLPPSHPSTHVSPSTVRLLDATH